MGCWECLLRGFCRIAGSVGEFGCCAFSVLCTAGGSWGILGGAGLCQGIGVLERGAGGCNGGLLWVLVMLWVLGLGPLVHMTALLTCLQRRRW